MKRILTGFALEMIQSITNTEKKKMKIGPIEEAIQNNADFVTKANIGYVFSTLVQRIDEINKLSKSKLKGETGAIFENEIINIENTIVNVANILEDTMGWSA